MTVNYAVNESDSVGFSIQDGEEITTKVELNSPREKSKAPLHQSSELSQKSQNCHAVTEGYVHRDIPSCAGAAKFMLPLLFTFPGWDTTL